MNTSYPSLAAEEITPASRATSKIRKSEEKSTAAIPQSCESATSRIPISGRHLRLHCQRADRAQKAVRFGARKAPASHNPRKRGDGNRHQNRLTGRRPGSTAQCRLGERLYINVRLRACKCFRGEQSAAGAVSARGHAGCVTQDFSRWTEGVKMRAAIG